MSSQYHFKNKNIYSANPLGDPTMGYCCFADGSKEVKTYNDCITESGLFYLEDADCPQQPEVGCCCACSYVEVGAAQARQRNAAQWTKVHEVYGSRHRIALGSGTHPIKSYVHQPGDSGPEGYTVVIGGSGVDPVNGRDEYDGNVEDPVGEVKVLNYNNELWTEITLSPDDAGDYASGDKLKFGSTVEIRDDVIFVLAEDSTDSDNQYIYVFEYSGSSWAQTAKIQTNNTFGDPSTSYGKEIIVNQDKTKIFVSDSNVNALGVQSSGLVHVFEKNTSWNDLSYSAIGNSPPTGYEHFGFAIAFYVGSDGYERLLISTAPINDTDFSEMLGVVHKRKYDGNSWVDEGTIDIKDDVNVNSDEIGIAQIEHHDSTLIIRTILDDADESTTFPSRQYIYEDMNGNGDWQHQTELVVSSYDGDHNPAAFQFDVSSSYVTIQDLDDLVYVWDKPSGGWAGDPIVESNTIPRDYSDYSNNFWGYANKIVDDRFILVSQLSHTEPGGLTGCGRVAIYETGADPTGACCVGETCNDVTEFQCQGLEGTFLGNGSVCSPTSCTQTGVCCISEVCFDNYTQSDCVNEGGTYLGNKIECSSSPCGSMEEVGGCCVDDNCSQQTATECSTLGGIFLGVNVPCETDSCLFTSACCKNNECADRVTEEDCQEDGGLWFAPRDILCENVSCEFEGDVGLEEVTQCECDRNEGVWIGGPCSNIDDVDLACSEYNSDGELIDAREKNACCYYSDYGEVLCDNVCSIIECYNLSSELYPGSSYYGEIGKKCPGTNDGVDEIAECILIEEPVGPCCYATGDPANPVYHCEILKASECFNVSPDPGEIIIDDSICFHGDVFYCEDGGYQICGPGQEGCYGACCTETNNNGNGYPWRGGYTIFSIENTWLNCFSDFDIKMEFIANIIGTILLEHYSTWYENFQQWIGDFPGTLYAYHQWWGSDCVASYSVHDDFFELIEEEVIDIYGDFDCNFQHQGGAYDTSINMASIMNKHLELAAVDCSGPSGCPDWCDEHGQGMNVVMITRGRMPSVETLFDTYWANTSGIDKPRYIIIHVDYNNAGLTEQENDLKDLAEKTGGNYTKITELDSGSVMISKLENILGVGNSVNSCNMTFESDCDGLWFNGVYCSDDSVCDDIIVNPLSGRNTEPVIENIQTRALTQFYEYLSQDYPDYWEEFGDYYSFDFSEENSERNIKRLSTGIPPTKNDELISSCCFMNSDGSAYSCSDSTTQEWCESNEGIWNYPLDSLPIKCNSNPCPTPPREENDTTVNIKYSPITLNVDSFNGLNVGDSYQGGIYVGMFEPGGDVNINGSFVVGNPETGPANEYNATGKSSETSNSKWALILYPSDYETTEKELFISRTITKTSTADGHYNIYGNGTDYYGISSKLANHIRKINLYGYDDWYIMSRDELAFVAKTIKDNTSVDFEMNGLYITSSLHNETIGNSRYLYGQELTNGNDFGYVELISPKDLSNSKFNRKYNIKLARRIYIS